MTSWPDAANTSCTPGSAPRDDSAVLSAIRTLVVERPDRPGPSSRDELRLRVLMLIDEMDARTAAKEAFEYRQISPRLT